MRGDVTVLRGDGIIGRPRRTPADLPKYRRGELPAIGFNFGIPVISAKATLPPVPCSRAVLRSPYAVDGYDLARDATTSAGSRHRSRGIGARVGRALSFASHQCCAISSAARGELRLRILASAGTTILVFETLSRCAG
ncbi:unnamed protein product, partial [Iphiclides podalirius]